MRVMDNHMFNNIFSVLDIEVKESEKKLIISVVNLLLCKESTALSSIGVTTINQEGSRTHSLITNNKIT